MSREREHPNASPSPSQGPQGQEAKTGASGKSDVKASIPSITPPKGGGAIRGIGEKFAANPVTGTGSLTVPLATSPGRSGFGPQLSLSYDSGAGNGPFGFGWSLSLPSVTRKTDKGLPRYLDAEESDVFIISGAEDLVPVLAEAGGQWQRESPPPRNVDGADYRVERYRPRVEGLFALVERWTSLQTGESHWRSITRDNVTSIYGRDDNSKIFAPDDTDPRRAKRVFSWLICESYDDKGNAVAYEYAAENGANVDPTQVSEHQRARTSNRYPKRISYGNKVSHLVQPDLSQAEWLFELVFDYDEAHYEELPLDPLLPKAEQHRFARASTSPGAPWAVRPDPFSAHRAGFEVRAYRRCRRVLMFHRFAELGDEPCLVRATEFDYADLDYSQPVTIEAELAHRGSTRFASFIQAVTQSGFVRDEARPVLELGGVKYVTYLKQSLPPLQFEYSKAEIQEEVRELDAESLENLPAGLDGAAYQWIDLDGEGVSGILAEQAGAWFYKPNLGEGRFGPARVVAPAPSLADLRGGQQQLLDLAGDGRLDLASFAGPCPGFYERTGDDGWESFRTFARLPNLRWDDPNLRFVDLGGDGHADILVTEDDVLTWHPSLGEDGFDAARHVRKPHDEERGPRLLLADGTQSIYLADMCGDGLTDLVRVRNGEVCYWPNLGYGRFGAKVTMEDAPRLDHPEQFDQRRVRLADIDGSGTTDIIYLGRDGVRLYFNQSGNRWSGPRRLPQLPRPDNLSSVTTADLLGNGTACLVWSSPLPADARRPVRYVDLMGGQKPHLLVALINNLGAETRVQYAASTKFYLADKAAGRPWVTRLPFPVHIVERVETYDRVSGNRFVTRYSYRHGYFDGVEREFRGFGLVEQWDTEEFAALDESQQIPAGANVEQSSHVPPVLTRTWFHTGVHLGRDHVSDFFAGSYFRKPNTNDAQVRELLLEDTVLPQGLTVEEEREACRALKGLMLRQEVYALDGTGSEPFPYAVTEQNFAVRCLQPRADNRHAVFFTHAHESLQYYYERDPSDPRTSHALTLEVDEFGNVLKEAAVSYGRREPDTDLSLATQAEQARTLVTYTEHDFTNAVESTDDYRAPLPCESRTYELTGLSLQPNRVRFDAADIRNAGAGAVTIGYHESPVVGVQQRRLIDHARQFYRRDNLAGALPVGVLEPLALPFESYQLAFTQAMLVSGYCGPVTDAVLDAEGRYVHGASDADWWAPSGQVFYSPTASDSPQQELAYARAHFFLPHRQRDPFHADALSTESFVFYDTHDLLPAETRDALSNRVTAGERDAADNVLSPSHDYRVLQPRLVSDANRNRTAYAFDALGLLVATVLMGKPEDAPARGDRLDAAFRADLTLAEIEQFFADPKGPHATALLGDATSRIIYDQTCYWREPDPQRKPPAFVATLARETHVSDPAPPGGTKVQVNFSYSDGFGREIQKKAQAEPGPVPVRDPETGRVVLLDGQPQMTANDAATRWTGGGWTVFNNKGKPVRQYEPFFTDTHRFEFDVRVGVSPVLFYDPVGRVVVTLHPDHTWEKVVFDAWLQATWDASDTVLASDPATDTDVGDFFLRLPASEYLPTWHAQRQSGALGTQAQAAALKAAVHAGTPTVAHFDSLGRAFHTVAHNRFKHGDAPASDPPIEEFPGMRVVFDIEGNQRAVIDALERAVMRYDYDMLGRRIHQLSADAGERWMLEDVTGKPVRAWGSRGHELHTAYDVLRRPAESYLRAGAGPELLVARTTYGEALPNPETSNLRARVVEVFDQAGVVSTNDYDFKGNPLRNERRLAREYRTTLDWSAQVPLEKQSYINLTLYDALNRPTEMTTPDGTVIRPTYNEANLLERVEASLRGAASPTLFVADIDYDAKGQRRLIDYGNGVRTIYGYDPLTFRLVRLVTTRDAAAFPADCPTTPDTGWPGCYVQNLSYTYDPAGNITHVRDEAQQTIYFDNQRVEPSAEYTYDALYRLIEATGREHLGQSAQSPSAPDAFNYFHTHPADPRDGAAVGRYLERYFYDGVGNILSVRHRGSNASRPGWQRCYQYADDSNRLLSTGDPNAPHDPDIACPTHYAPAPVYAEQYDHDAHGNVTRMPHLPLMQWDYRDQLQATAQQVVNKGTPETTWYVYDAEGQRVRKVTDRQSAPGHAPTRMKERIYLDGFEVYREFAADGATVELERETLHVMDDKQRVALVETRTLGKDPAPPQVIRYQFGNHLASSTLELDEQAQLISYEEYFPYGGTSYQAARNQTDTPKRYRYTGMERDEESGLAYHGARYYSPWLGKWLNPDPAGMVDGYCLYQYARSNPVRLLDTNGFQSKGTPIGMEITMDKSLRRELGISKKQAENYTPSRLKAMFQREYGIGVRVVKGRLTYTGEVKTNLKVSETAKQMWIKELTGDSKHSLHFTFNDSEVDPAYNVPVNEKDPLEGSETTVDVADFDLTKPTQPLKDALYLGVSERAVNLARVLEHEVLGHGVKGFKDAYMKSKIPDHQIAGESFHAESTQGDTVEFGNELSEEMDLPTRLVYGRSFGSEFEQDGEMKQMVQFVFSNGGRVVFTDGADLNLKGTPDWFENMKGSKWGDSHSKPRYGK